MSAPCEQSTPVLEATISPAAKVGDPDTNAFHTFMPAAAATLDAAAKVLFEARLLRVPRDATLLDMCGLANTYFLLTEMAPGPPQGCPMHAASAGNVSDDATALGQQKQQRNGSAAICPFPHAAAAQAPPTTAADAEKPPLECPMGFGAGNTAKLDPLACIICRTLYFEAAKTACQHSFCCFCIAPFRDCPICGADCKPLSPDAEMQGERRQHCAHHVHAFVCCKSGMQHCGALLTEACCANPQRQLTGI